MSKMSSASNTIEPTLSFNTCVCGSGSGCAPPINFASPINPTFGAGPFGGSPLTLEQALLKVKNEEEAKQRKQKEDEDRKDIVTIRLKISKYEFKESIGRIGWSALKEINANGRTFDLVSFGCALDLLKEVYENGDHGVNMAESLDTEW
jgi:hypothetical protein